MWTKLADDVQVIILSFLPFKSVVRGFPLCRPQHCNDCGWWWTTVGRSLVRRVEDPLAHNSLSQILSLKLHFPPRQRQRAWLYLTLQPHSGLVNVLMNHNGQGCQADIQEMLIRYQQDLLWKHVQIVSSWLTRLDPQTFDKMAFEEDRDDDDDGDGDDGVTRLVVRWNDTLRQFSPGDWLDWDPATDTSRDGLMSTMQFVLVHAGYDSLGDNEWIYAWVSCMFWHLVGHATHNPEWGYHWIMGGDLFMELLCYWTDKSQARRVNELIHHYPKMYQYVIRDWDFLLLMWESTGWEHPTAGGVAWLAQITDQEIVDTLVYRIIRPDDDNLAPLVPFLANKHVRRLPSFNLLVNTIAKSLITVFKATHTDVLSSLLLHPKITKVVWPWFDYDRDAPLLLNTYNMYITFQPFEKCVAHFDTAVTAAPADTPLATNCHTQINTTNTDRINFYTEIFVLQNVVHLTNAMREAVVNNNVGEFQRLDKLVATWSPGAELNYVMMAILQYDWTTLQFARILFQNHLLVQRPTQQFLEDCSLLMEKLIQPPFGSPPTVRVVQFLCDYLTTFAMGDATPTIVQVVETLRQTNQWIIRPVWRRWFHNPVVALTDARWDMIRTSIC
eukprot:GILJ01014639.1.p1 GENE.GILJ01014639.1~~GILJ01014639.1.p1  ORF type:complete len:613 (+),score=50.18 GILJ01014639.1:166-2004(+)